MICAKFHVVKKIGHEFQSLDTPSNVGITLCYINCRCDWMFLHILLLDPMRYDEMEIDEESEPEMPIYNRAELIERYQVSK